MTDAVWCGDQHDHLQRDRSSGALIEWLGVRPVFALVSLVNATVSIWRLFSPGLQEMDKHSAVKT
jgi:hypothetical protein